MAGDPRYVLEGHTVQREVTLKEGMTHVESRNGDEFLAALGGRALTETGLLPPGLVSVRRAGAYEQLVVVLGPAIERVIWGAYEHDGEAKSYPVAQPYRIYIGEFKEGQFLGGRMFYSPTPITGYASPLYHANVPNLNCKGYRGNGVGWVCLYHRDTTTAMTLAERVAYLGLRMSGNEAYNDANMSETDGARFYQAAGKPRFTWDPAAWEAKTDTDGLHWVTDPELWLPITVGGIDDQDRHRDGGEPLTLGMAMTGTAAYYYGDHDGPRLYNAHARGLEVAPERLAREVLVPAYQAAALTGTWTREAHAPAPVADAIIPAGTSPMGTAHELADLGSALQQLKVALYKDQAQTAQAQPGLAPAAVVVQALGPPGSSTGFHCEAPGPPHPPDTPLSHITAYYHVEGVFPSYLCAPHFEERYGRCATCDEYFAVDQLVVDATGAMHCPSCLTTAAAHVEAG